MRRSVSLLGREQFPLCLLFLAIAAAACLMPAQTDTWWQLRTGEAMWQSGRVMLHDEFTHTVAGQPWPNHEWLSQLVFYATYRVGGLPLLTALCAAAVTTAWVIVSLMTVTPGPPIVRVGLVGLGAMLSSPAWSLRPQVLTLALFAVTLWIVVRRRHVWILPALFLVWANLHGAVALGGVLVFAAWLAAAIRRESLGRWTGVGALCLLATAATPLGPSLWFEIPDSLRRLHAYGVLEWQAPQLQRLADLPFWMAAASLVTLVVLQRRKLRSSATLTLVLSTALLFILALRSSRHVPPFFVCAVPSIAALLPGMLATRDPVVEGPGRRWALNLAILLTCVATATLFVAVAWAQPLPRLGWRPLPERMVSTIAACPGRLYNRYDEGGYLIWFMKQRPVFIDSRQDPFPFDLIIGHINVERSGEYQALFDKYDIGCSLSREASPLAVRLRRDGWQELEAGSGWKVYRRPDYLEQNALAAR